MQAHIWAWCLELRLADIKCAMLLLCMAQHHCWSGHGRLHIVMQSRAMSQYGGGKSFQVPEPDGGAAKSCWLWKETWRHQQDL